MAFLMNLMPSLQQELNPVGVDCDLRLFYHILFTDLTPCLPDGHQLPTCLLYTSPSPRDSTSS
eukprot:6472629-Prorocentrum_lima.AAC.1